MSQELDKKEKRNRVFTYISIFTGLVPVLLILYCYNISGGSFSEAGSGAIWWLMIMYYGTFGIPLFILSIVFALYGLKSSKKILAIFSLFITCLPIIILFISLIFSN